MNSEQSLKNVFNKMDYYWATVVISVEINNLTITAKEVLCQLLLLLSFHIIFTMDRT